MSTFIKPFTAVCLLIVTCCLSYYGWAKEKVTVKQAFLSQVEHFDGPHLLYQNGQILQLDAIEQNGKMALNKTTHNALTQIDVFKPGEHSLSFTVPLKKQITNAPVSYQKPGKIFAMSDVEGNFNTVTDMLKRHKVIDQKLNWQYGDGHFIIIGDVFDRGNHVTELLWLLYRLEDQAKAQGGMVHMLIGNHEMMNLQNDLRYVEPKYTRLDELLKQQMNLTYTQLFGPDTELGRWLRSKNVVVKIGDILFTHGGMSLKMSENKLSLETINATMRAAIDTPKAKRNELETLLFGRNGPMWYRGYFMPIPNSPMVDEKELTEILNYYGAKAVAVGHTIVDKPMLKLGGKVIAVDVKHPADHLTTTPPRRSYGVLIEGDKRFVALDDGSLEQM